MPRVRVVVRSVAALWLFWQAATLALVPVLLDASVAACVCAHGPEASCPMHHKADGSRMCTIRSATTSSVVLVLNAVFNVSGLVPASSPAIVPALTVHAVPVERSTLTERPSTPNSPPPRA
jgi:hypothetical protein